MVWSWRRRVVMRTMRWLGCRSGGCTLAVLLMFTFSYVYLPWPVLNYNHIQSPGDTKNAALAEEELSEKLPDRDKVVSKSLPKLYRTKSGTHSTTSPSKRYRTQSGYSTKFPPKRYRTKVEVHSASFLNEVNKVRDKFIQRRYIWDFKSHEFTNSILVRPGIRGYFQTLSTYEKVETIFLEVPYSDLHEVLDYSHYNTTLTYAGQYYNKPNVVEFSGRLSSSAEQALLSATHFTAKDYFAYPVTQSPKNKDSVTVSYLHIFSGAIASRDGDIWYYSMTLRPGACKEKRLPAPLSKSDITTYNEVFTITQVWGENYYTFLAEALPRLLPYLVFLRERTTIRIHVSETTPFVMRYLTFLGIGGIRVITGNVRARVLYVPMGTPCRDPPPYTTQLMASYLQSPVDNVTKDAIVIVRRRAGQDRYLSHYAEIVQELRIIGAEFGLTVLEYKDNPVPSIASSKKTFQRALVIVAAHGAGLANMMFTPPGSLIVEALCHNPRLIYCFSRQAAVLGHLYAGILPQRHCRDTQPHAVTWVIKDFLNRMLKTKPTDPS